MIRFSSYDRVTDNRPKVLEVENFGELKELLLDDVQELGPQENKNDSPLISPVAEWHILTRRNSSVKTMSPFVVCDIDQVSNDDMDRVKNLLTNTSHIFYTSFNHGMKKTSSDEPSRLCRFRVILELANEYPASQHLKVWHAANKRLFNLVDPSTKDTSRMYTVPLLRKGGDD